MIEVVEEDVPLRPDRTTRGDPGEVCPLHVFEGTVTRIVQACQSRPREP